MSVVRAFAVVVAHDGGEKLVTCVRALLGSGYAAMHVLVVDNASHDGTFERIEAMQEESVSLLRMRSNLGFAGGVNAGVAHLQAHSEPAPDDVVILVNQDCVIRPGAVGALVTRALSDRSIGIVGARLLAWDGRTLEHAGGMIHANGLTDHVGRGVPDSALFASPRDVEYVTGALFAFRVSTWTALGPFDAGYQPLYFEEVDYCVRARRAGLRVVYEPASVALHTDGGSSGGPDSPLFLRRYHRSRMRFLARYRLRRGTFVRTLAAELRWLLAQRRLAQLKPALRAYMVLPREMMSCYRVGAGRRS
jgi:GT2 family glycosyltransferase